jgi:transposase
MLQGEYPMVAQRYVVRLTEAEREQLLNRVHKGRDSARRLNRARTLLKADGGWRDAAIAEALDLAVGTVARTRKRFVEAGLEGAPSERPRPGRRPKLDEKGEAHLIALACSQAPDGHDHWTLRLLAGKVVELGLADSLSHEGVRKRLKKTRSSRGRRGNGASQR